MPIEARSFKADHPAFFAADGTVTYAALEGLKADWGETLGPQRRLVFLQARNHTPAISLLLACLRFGHPVYLFDDATKIDGLISDYDPNLVVTWEEDAPKLDWQHTRELPLHEDLRVLLSTSGSTGSQKLVRLSEANLTANADSISEYLDIKPDDRAMTGLKFSYSFGLSIITSHIRAGASLVLTDHSVTEDAFWQSAERFQATSISGVPFTFELLHKTDRLKSLKSLRTVTQAGGRLPADLVAHYARLGEVQGWRFFVMFGQTEASPRIAYMPPESLLGNEDCIGTAIPSVRLDLIDADGQEIKETGVQGELVCTGPNVMMGYASGLGDLALAQGPDRLETGDLAEITEAGLFKIVGRKSRFVKLFGHRVNLDEVERWAQTHDPAARAVGTDEAITIALPSSTVKASAKICTAIASRLSVPAKHVRIVTDLQIPVLANGKTDYQALKRIACKGAGTCATATNSKPKLMVLSQLFFDKWQTALGFGEANYMSAHDVFEDHFEEEIADLDSFQSLAGDSLSFVSVFLGLETLCEAVPDTWPEMTVRQLQDLVDGH